MRNCTKSVSSSFFSDHRPSRGWLSKDTYLTLMWTLWKLMSALSLFITWGVEFIDSSPGVKCRLKQCVSYWESTISASRFVLDVISEGYKLPFSRVPAPCFTRNNRSAELHPALLRKIFPSCWLRPVIDLRHLIPCLYKYSCNWYEDLQSFREELLVFHLGYHHVDIFSGHQKFLGFSWPFSGMGFFLRLKSFHLFWALHVFVLRSC